MADAPNPSSENPASENPSSENPKPVTPLEAPAAPVAQSPAPTQAAPPAIAPPRAKKRAEKKDEPLDPAHVPMTEEFDRAKWTLPPIGIVLIGIAIVAVVAVILAFTTRATPVVAGGIDNATAVQLPDNTSLVSVQLHIGNDTKKQWYIEGIKATVKTDKGEWSDDAAAATDSARYFQAFPALGQVSTQVLKFDQKLAPGEKETGTVIFSFPITKDEFDKRKSLSVTIQPFDNLPVTFTK